LQEGDIILAYLKSKGYVGLGRVVQKREKAIDFKVNGERLINLKEKLYQKNIFENSDDDDLAQYCVGVEWLKKLEKNAAIWEKNRNLFTTQQVVASMLNQPATIEYLSKEFGVDIFGLIDG
jgi:hypothetical protein